MSVCILSLGSSTWSQGAYFFVFSVVSSERVHLDIDPAYLLRSSNKHEAERKLELSLEDHTQLMFYLLLRMVMILWSDGGYVGVSV